MNVEDDFLETVGCMGRGCYYIADGSQVSPRSNHSHREQKRKVNFERA